MVGSEVKIWVAVIIIAVALGFGLRYARGETPDEWWELVTAIEQQDARLDADERRFIANVRNRLAVRRDAVPTPEHARWLRNIKTRLGL